MKVGTLFSGIGAPEFAMKSLHSHTIEFACDNDPMVKETYLANHKCKKFYDDVMAIKDIPIVDLLVFGFPCQPFSFAGRQGGLADERGSLVFKVLDLMKRNKPRMFIAENVEGFARMNNGEVLKSLLRKIQRMGYAVQHTILNALDFGIPQSRKRLWIVGTLDQNFVFPTTKMKTPPLADFLDRDVKDNVFATKKFLSKPKVQERLRDYSSPYINCITQTICRNGSSSEYISYVAAVYRAIGQKRKPTVKECCRLFGLPNEFYFPESVSTTRRYAMLANSMVVSVLESLIKGMI